MISCTALVKYRAPCKPLLRSGNDSHWLTARKVPLRAADIDELSWLLGELANDTLEQYAEATAVHTECRYNVDLDGKSKELRYAVGYFAERIK